MKRIKFLTVVFMTMCLSLFQMSCSHKVAMVETFKAPFAELQANVNRINAKYEKLLIKKDWGKEKDAAQTDIQAEPEKKNEIVSNNPSGGNKISINTDALPELNGNLIEDNAGYIHNAVIINLYEKFGDALNEFSDLELANAINSEYDEVVRNSNLISNATIENDIDIEAVNNFISLVGSCNDVDELINTMIREYPACRNELEVIGSVLKQLAEKDIDEDIIDDYVEEIIYAIKSSAIPNNSKDVLKSIISVAGASRQIWDLE